MAVPLEGHTVTAVLEKCHPAEDLGFVGYTDLAATSVGTVLYALRKALTGWIDVHSTQCHKRTEQTELRFQGVAGTGLHEDALTVLTPRPCYQRR